MAGDPSLLLPARLWMWTQSRASRVFGKCRRKFARCASSCDTFNARGEDSFEVGSRKVTPPKGQPHPTSYMVPYCP